MPEVVVNPGIRRAARNAVEVLLRFKGIDIELVPAKQAAVPKAGGGHDFPKANGSDRRPSQKFSVSKVGADIVDAGEHDDGRVVMRNYSLVGRWDAEIAVGDTWSDDEADYIVETLDQSSGYKTAADVLGYLKGEET